MYLFAPARNRPRDQRGTGGTSIVIPLALIFVGRPVIHSTSRSPASTLPTVNNPFTCSRSLEFSHPMISPVDLANPAFSAAYNPWFVWLNQQLTCPSYFRIISTVPSVDPSFTTMYSRFGYPWFTIDRIVASRYSSPLYTAVTSVIFGHSLISLEHALPARFPAATSPFHRPHRRQSPFLQQVKVFVSHHQRAQRIHPVDYPQPPRQIRPVAAIVEQQMRKKAQTARSFQQEFIILPPQRPAVHEGSHLGLLLRITVVSKPFTHGF